jgi:hypothetical protein
LISSLRNLSTSIKLNLKIKSDYNIQMDKRTRQVPNLKTSPEPQRFKGDIASMRIRAKNRETDLKLWKVHVVHGPSDPTNPLSRSVSKFTFTSKNIDSLLLTLESGGWVSGVEFESIIALFVFSSLICR